MLLTWLGKSFLQLPPFHSPSIFFAYRCHQRLSSRFSRHLLTAPKVAALCRPPVWSTSFCRVSFCHLCQRLHSGIAWHCPYSRLQTQWGCHYCPSISAAIC